MFPAPTSLPSPSPASPSNGCGRGRLVARWAGGRTALAEARSSSPLRYVVPTFATQPRGASVCLVTFGGGLVDGDDLEVDIEVERGATLVVFTQASTKVFRGSSRQCLRARVAGTLVVLLDPVACFAGARYEQRTEIALEDDGACVVLDGFTSGRPAYGERWRMDGLLMRTRVTRGATRLLDDAVRLDARDAPIAERMQGFDAFLTVSAVGASAAPVCAALLARAGHGPSSRGERAALVAPNALPSGGALVRIASASPEVALAEARHRLRNLPDIDAVDTFGARR